MGKTALIPKGPRGEKRPADVIGNAVYVMRIATGEITDTPPTNAEPSEGRQDRREETRRQTDPLLD
jgi:hypothetical protein